MKIMRFIKRSWGKLIFLFYILWASFFTVYAAQDPGSDCEGKICNPLKGINSVPEFIKVLLEGVLKIGIPIVALALIYCGFLFVAARGNTEKLTKAKDAFLYTLIGAAILLGSWAIARLLLETVI